MRSPPSTRPRGSRGRGSSAFVRERHAHLAVSCQPQPPRGSHGLHVEDVRQRALALQRAAAEVEALSFRYIFTMNSDMVPHDPMGVEILGRLASAWQQRSRWTQEVRRPSRMAMLAIV